MDHSSVISPLPFDLEVAEKIYTVNHVLRGYFFCLKILRARRRNAHPVCKAQAQGALHVGVASLSRFW
jgi:hypothetical protein